METKPRIFVIGVEFPKTVDVGKIVEAVKSSSGVEEGEIKHYFFTGENFGLQFSDTIDDVELFFALKKVE